MKARQQIFGLVVSTNSSAYSLSNGYKLGVILFVFLAGYLPFDETSTDLLFKKIQKGNFKIPPWFSPGSRCTYLVSYRFLFLTPATQLTQHAALISQLLVVDPTKRITIEEIKNDTWFKVDNETPKLCITPHTEPPAQPSTFQSIEDEDTSEAEDHDSSLPKVVINGLTVTNAFDLIALSGVLGQTKQKRNENEIKTKTKQPKQPKQPKQSNEITKKPIPK
jgi:serine/threonine protein kinase